MLRDLHVVSRVAIAVEPAKTTIMMAYRLKRSASPAATAT
jgi:hypothetical protein